MNDNTKKYRRSPASIVCYVVAALMLLYIVYMIGSTVAQINQYYAQYDMKAQPMEYVTYILQAILTPLINVGVFFMLGYILDEVRKNNPAYYLSDEEIEQAKVAKKEEKLAKQEAKAAKKAAEEAAAAKPDITAAAESSVEEDFVRSLDEELNKDAAKKAPRKKTNNSQKKTGENKSNQANQKSQNNQGSQNRKKADGAKSNSGNKEDGSGSSSRKKSSKKPAADKAKAETENAS
ncbi:MAG: hypothetical protein IKF42_14285, partial [Mogibacterium sp.]|nr:hypothetical protein [Mogibacterium sp.]